ncbi:DNA-binding HxlR family transcriptional regulator [Hamadaea flava]|uniref:Winged helix-turn-helix transcriptional regulator n=1 Tax=Hamadaea flava TaxID=1742688 RepID=A0ABV8LPX3_9ACTN|nr:winged helix-turn-helix transcriptional regulator [Hamadaea flava]MCP2322971.1 DNA-binding HxlR family transcriptional regulator [Hamadaea flava]
MAGKRRFDDPCGVARALEVVGERWALLVVRELLLGPKRFTELSRGLPGMSQNVLSQRLRELEESGVVRKRRLGPPVSATAYELSEVGRLLDPVLIALATFGSRLPLPPTDTPMSADAFALALRTTFDSQTSTDGSVELRIDDDVFHASVHDGRFEIARGSATQPDATLTGSVSALRSAVFGGRPLTEDIRVDGDRRAAERFVRLFPRPQPMPGP